MTTASNYNAADVIRDIAEESFKRIVREIGPGFHTDTDPEEYENVLTNERLFSYAEACSVRWLLEGFQEVLGRDRYEAAALEAITGNG